MLKSRHHGEQREPGMIEVKESLQNKKAMESIRKIGPNTRRGLRQSFFQYGHDLKRTASRQILEKPKGGRTYRVKRGTRRVRHIASAPGESPANLSGKYRRSIGFNIRGSSQMIFGAGSSKVPYAVWLERGTKRMLPRPGLGNAIRATERNAKKYFASNIRRSIGA